MGFDVGVVSASVVGVGASASIIVVIVVVVVAASDWKTSVDDDDDDGTSVGSASSDDDAGSVDGGSRDMPAIVASDAVRRATTSEARNEMK